MATKRITMTNLMQELSYQLGEITVPTSGVDSRKVFLQRALEDVWKLYPWPFSLTDTTLTFSGGVATLPDDFLPEGNYYVSKNNKEINETDYSSRAEVASTTYYIRYVNDEYQAVLLNSADFTAELRYQYTAPDLTLNATARAPYPNLRTIAKGALRDTVKADNPEADNAQEASAFLASAQEDYSAFNRMRSKNKRIRGVAEASGHSTGEF